MRRKKILTLILYIYITIVSLSNITFDKLTTENGLISDEVMCLTQDNNGFLWIGTKIGLNRYDGCEYKKYSQNNNNFKNDYINTLYADKEDNLWVGTGVGLSKIDLKNGKIKNYTQEDGFEENQMVMDIIEDSNGIIWFVSREKGLTKFIEKENNFIKINEISKDATSIAKDSSGNLWIGTYNGLYKVNKKIEKIDSNLLLDEWVQDVIIDENDCIWITAKGKGISTFNRDINKIKHYKINNNNEEKKIDSLIRSIATDEKGNIWVGTASEGLFILNRKNGVFKRYYYQSENENSLPGNSITKIYSSEKNNMWIGTNGSGLAKYNKSKNKFILYKNNRKNPNSLKKGKVTAIYENKKGDLWIGLYDNGISKLEAGSEKFKHYNKDSNSKLKISSDRIFSLIEVEEENELWVGTAGGGLDIFNLKTGEKENYKDGKRGFRAKNNTAFRIYKDSKGIIWVGSYYSGINKYDRKTKTFKNYQHNENDKNSLSQNTVDVIFEDSDGFLWIGTDKGLNKFDPKTEKFIHYFTDKENKNTISSDIALAINEDKNKNLWIGQYHGGLNKINLKTGKVTRYGKEEGLPDMSVGSILFDEKENIWFGTKNGLCKLNVNSGVIQEFTKKDGLQSNQFYMGAYFKNTKGEMYFGGVNGFNKFNPENIKEREESYKLKLTEFKTIDREIKGIEFKDAIKLAYKENSFRIGFTALNFNDSNKQRYRYRILNKGKKWMSLGREHYLIFSQIRAGKYLLEIQTTKENGDWNKEGRKLRITISNPWWNTGIAYILYIVILVIFIFILRKVEKRKKERELLIEEKKNIQELMEIRTRFIADMSHEIRTPLTSMLGAIELLNILEKPDDYAKYLKILNSSGEMLESIVNNVLDISKLDSGELELEEREINIDEILEEVVMMFEIEVEQKGLKLEYLKEVEIRNPFLGDALRIKQIFINLIKNSIKFTENGGVKLILKKKQNLGEKTILMLIVEDTGIGLKKEEIRNLFKRYKQANEKISRKYGGTGLGLNIVKQLVELMNGNIKVESEKNKWTRFTVQIELKEKIKKKLKSDQNESEIKILIVDDDEINRKVISEILKRMEVTNEVVETGKEALEKMKENDYDFLLTDFHMPEMDGLELSKKIKERNKKVKIILLSGENNVENENIDFFLKKPLNKKKIEDIILKNRKEEYYKKEELVEYLGGDEKLVKKYLAMLIESIPERIEKIEKSLHRNKWNEIKKELHKFKGSIGFLGTDKKIYIYLVKMEEINEGEKKIFEKYLERLKKEIKKMEKFYKSLKKTIEK